MFHCNRLKWSPFLSYLLVVLILGDYRVGPQVLSFAYDQGLTDGDYAFIIVQLDQEQFVRNLGNSDLYYVVQRGVEDKPIDQCEYFRAFESVIIVEIETIQVGSDANKEFEKQVLEKFDEYITFPESKVSWLFLVVHVVFACVLKPINL